MFDNRSLKLDLCALALLAAVAFLGVSLWSYDRFDPPSTLVDPPSQAVHNACGLAGAYTANFLFESLGYGTYYLAGSLAVLDGDARWCGARSTSRCSGRWVGSCRWRA